MADEVYRLLLVDDDPAILRLYGAFLAKDGWEVETARDGSEAQAMIEARRHSIFKLKIGKRSVADDVAHVAAIKKALGDRGSVRGSDRE